MNLSNTIQRNSNGILSWVAGGLGMSKPEGIFVEIEKVLKSQKICDRHLFIIRKRIEKVSHRLPEDIKKVVRENGQTLFDFLIENQKLGNIYLGLQRHPIRNVALAKKYFWHRFDKDYPGLNKKLIKYRKFEKISQALKKNIGGNNRVNIFPALEEIKNTKNWLEDVRMEEELKEKSLLEKIIHVLTLGILPSLKKSIFYFFRANTQSTIKHIENKLTDNKSLNYSESHKTDENSFH